MQNLIKENWFKVIIAVAILIVAIGYLFSQLETQESQQAGESVLKKEECRKLGEKYHKKLTEDMRTSSEAGISSWAEEPRYAYNSTLNTCLYSGGYTMTAEVESPPPPYRFVIDLYTNRTILERTRLSSLTEEEYFIMEAELMSP